jgi:Fe-S-cluster-containing dehydrogenase component
MMKMPRWGMVIDLDKCTGCQACVVACKLENNVPFAEPKEAAKGRVISWMEILTTVSERARPLFAAAMHAV